MIFNKFNMASYMVITSHIRELHQHDKIRNGIINNEQPSYLYRGFIFKKARV